MAMTEMNYPNSGGSIENTTYNIVFAHASGAIINQNTQGKAHSIYITDATGYIYTNVNPTTNEITDTSMFYCNLAGTTWSEDTSKYFIRTDGNVKTNATIRNSNLNMCMVYTVE